MDTIDCLVLGGRIPPGVDQEHLRGRGEVDSERAALEGDQHDADRAVRLKLVDVVVACLALHLAIQPAKLKLGAVEEDLDHIQHGGPLGEDDALDRGVLLTCSHQVLDQGVRLGARFDLVSVRRRPLLLGKLFRVGRDRESVVVHGPPIRDQVVSAQLDTAHRAQLGDLVIAGYI